MLLPQLVLQAGRLGGLQACLPSAYETVLPFPTSALKHLCLCCLGITVHGKEKLYVHHCLASDVSTTTT